MRPRKKGFIIAMDGPAGVGKSAVGHLLAKKLGYFFLNTGEMYRALTWKALQEGLEPGGGPAIEALALRLKWKFQPTSDGTLKTYVDGEDVGAHIRDEKVSANSSLVAAHAGVRRLMCRLQRRLGKDGGVVMEGRDITTHVFPDAEFKVYLDASVEERADRRYRQLKASGKPADRQKIKEAILKRDLNDLQRKINPLTRASDAMVIDSTRLTLHQVANKILRAVKNAPRP
ncbi:MAG TPA: (d)CMP kinase [Elusimicrobiota bacterium]|nr:(d)CMP kinase [Elusimicrobiota bacterium]